VQLRFNSLKDFEARFEPSGLAEGRDDRIEARPAFHGFVLKKCRPELRRVISRLRFSRFYIEALRWTFFPTCNGLKKTVDG